jgi:dipeptidyl aminopeptidase/acylaminoacyl peptidase
MRHLHWSAIAFILIVCEFMICRASVAQNPAPAGDLTLEKLFPKRKLFGPSASSIEFSFDGKYAAYLYRPNRERRHGGDLWIYDTASGQAKRVTSVSAMSQFQKNARKVRDDRIKKANEDLEKRRKEAKSEQEGKALALTDEQKRGDWVTDDDGELEEVYKEKEEAGQPVEKDKKAPRYGGIESLEWSKTANEMIFASDGDLYRYNAADGKITRLTCTKERERRAAWLPDGSGYVCLRDNALVRTLFGNHVVQELDLPLPQDERLQEFELSRDGLKIAFETTKELPTSQTAKRFNIAKYRDRLMQTESLERNVLDDPVKPVEMVAYICRLNDPTSESTEIFEVLRQKITSPREIVSPIDWAPDSSRAVFMAYQPDGVVQILEARFPEPPKKDDKATSPPAESKPKADENPDKPKQQPARQVFRFMHTGGPGTPYMISPKYLADNRRIVFLSEQTGFRQLHVLDPTYESVQALTQGNFEVYPIDISKNREWMFVLATKENPARLDVYRVAVADGKMERLTPREGCYEPAAVSPDGAKVLANYAHYGALPELVFAEGGNQKALTDSHPQAAKDITTRTPEFFSYDNRNGQKIYGSVFKPKDWKKEDKRPALIYLYGGPLGRNKQVADGNYHRSGYFFAYYMAEKHGYVTCTIDPRGCSGYGAVYEKANFQQAGRPQVEDVVDGVKHLIANYGVDPKRVAVHGWSFGGFQTQMCMYTEPDTFAAGMAGAGPTEWENYNMWYTRATIGENPSELKKGSLLPLAKNLKGQLLLVHGMEDRNVLYQDTVRVYRELLKANKETLVELFLDPTGDHHLDGDVKSLALYRKYEQFLMRTVGEYKP